MENTNINDKVQNFFTNLYYECDILALTGVNCYDYKNGKVNINAVINAIKENNLNIKLEFNY